MSKFHKLPVKNINKLTSDAVCVEFKLNDESKSVFKFNAGEYITLKTVLEGKEIRRSYSICSAPFEEKLVVGIKQVEGGLFSSFANDVLKVGDVLEVMPPMGNFKIVTSKNTQKHYCFFAAGSGITPILSMIKTVLSEQPLSTVTLIYGNKTFESIMFREDIEALKNAYMQRFFLHHVLSRSLIGNTLNRGRIDVEKCEKLFSSLFQISFFDDFYMCGPFHMIMDLKQWLSDQNVPVENIHFELFGTPSKKERNQTAKTVLSDQNSKNATVEIIKDGDRVKFTMPSVDENILDAAYNLGLDIPYACKGGVCCTCKAKILEGKAEMKANYALEEDEVKQGYVLTCQALVKSDTIKLSFDE